MGSKVRWEGGKSVSENRPKQRVTAIPRGRVINECSARKICRDLDSQALIHFALVYVEVRIHFLNVVVVVESFVKFHHLFGVSALELDVVLRDH